LVVERLSNVLAGLRIKEQMPAVYIGHVIYGFPCQQINYVKQTFK